MIEREQLRVIEREQAFDKDKLTGLYGLSASGDTDMIGKIVERPFDGFSPRERRNVRDEE
jgi:hypothetical protein